MKVFRKKLIEWDAGTWADLIDGKEVVKGKNGKYHPKEKAYKDFIIDGAWVEDTELQDRIDKAIEFIKLNKWNADYEDDCNIYLIEEDINELLKILKGESNGN